MLSRARYVIKTGNARFKQMVADSVHNGDLNEDENGHGKVDQNKTSGSMKILTVRQYKQMDQLAPTDGDFVNNSDSDGINGQADRGKSRTSKKKKSNDIFPECHVTSEENIQFNVDGYYNKTSKYGGKIRNPRNVSRTFSVEGTVVVSAGTTWDNCESSNTDLKTRNTIFNSISMSSQVHKLTGQNEENEADQNRPEAETSTDSAPSTNKVAPPSERKLSLRRRLFKRRKKKREKIIAWGDPDDDNETK